MSKEKQQINEMALAICKSRGVAEVDDCGKCGRYADCLYYEIACGLYKADYRRQSEGEWIYEYTGDCLEGTDASLDFKCSLCGDLATNAFGYCPNCGAHMKGGAE